MLKMYFVSSLICLDNEAMHRQWSEWFYWKSSWNWWAIPILCCSGKLVKDKTNRLGKCRDFAKDHCIEGVYGFQVTQTNFGELTRTQKYFKKSYIKKKLNRKIGFASLRWRVKNSNQTIKWVSQSFPKW